MPPPAFYAQECAIYMNSSASRAGVVANTPDFEVGYGMLPYYDDVEGAPQNSIIGGATLWVLSGGTPEEEAGVAAFFEYLASAEVQAAWHQETGYLPITQAAYDLSTEQGYYAANPGADVSILQMTLKRAHRQFARSAVRQLRADPHHHRRKSSSACWPATSMRRARSTHWWNAATR